MAEQQRTTNKAKHAGARAFIATVADLAAVRDNLMGEAALPEMDWPRIVDRLQASLDANLRHADPLHRQGYLRALVDLLLTAADGFVPGPEWDARQAIANTAGGFDRLALPRPGR